MKEYLYEIIDDRGNTIATKLSLKDALIFVESLFDHYYEEEKISYSIVRLIDVFYSDNKPIMINQVPLNKDTTLEDIADIFCNLTDDQKDFVYFMMDKARNENQN